MRLIRKMFSAQLKDGLGILSMQARTKRLLSVISKMLTVSYHSFLYSIVYKLAQIFRNVNG